MSYGKNIALILSGGTGKRLGADIPKQYIEVCGRPIISYCIERLFMHDKIDIVWIVAEPAWQPLILECMEGLQQKKFQGFSMPGTNRQLSIMHALEDMRAFAEDLDYVFIHDAVRPLLTERQITDCLDAVIGHDGLVPVLPMKDTVYTSVDGKSLTSLLNRSQIYAGQAPEVFQLGIYYEANRRLLPDEILKINGSAEPAVLANMDVAVIPGDEGNFKITTKADLERFERIVTDRHLGTQGMRTEK